jgi:hypothetical protein
MSDKTELKPTDAIPNEKILVKYDGKTFGPYPNAEKNLTIKVVQRELAKQFPEAANCEISQKVLDDGSLELTFTKKAGRKGAASPGKEPGIDVLSSVHFHFSASTVEIAAWSPRQDGLDPTQVHFIMHLTGLDAPLVTRYKSADSLGYVIEELERYRRQVWPVAEPIPLGEAWRTDHPPADERVLVQVDYGRPARPKAHIAWYDYDRQRWLWECGSLSGTVTHWMQLPAEPERS